MNKSAIQKFAIQARIDLKEQVAQRCYQYGITKDGFGVENAETIMGRALSLVEQEQRWQLIQEIKNKGYDQVIEEVAYTWFNRFIALRYMEVNNYLRPARVFSDSTGAFKPEILSDVIHLDLPGLDMDKVMDFVDKNQTEELYRYLLLTQCNALNEALPRMFEKMGGFTELLLPNNILRPDSVVGRMVNDIPEDDWTDQVQIIGWLYQYYNAELKDETFALLKKNVKITKERIPSATQLFTPEWIVRYMVENSLGRLWKEHIVANTRDEYDEVPGDKNEILLSKWKYYVHDAEQNLKVEKQLAEIRKTYKDMRPQDIKVIDPCMGSGHILVYAFDVLMQIYEIEGWSQRDAATSIIEHNLYGLDIDDRAAQLAYFAVMMKARQYDRRIFSRGVQPNVFAIQESNNINRRHLKFFGWQMSDLERNLALNQLNAVLDEFIDAKEYGSILNISKQDWALLNRFVLSVDYSGQMTMEALGLEETKKLLVELVEIAATMSQNYDVVVTNPPYMGSGGMSAKLSDYVKKNYPDSKSDLFAVFIERCSKMTAKNRYQAMITQHAWMFLSSYEKLRAKLLHIDIVNMAHLGPRAFDEIGGEVVQTTSFVMRQSDSKGYEGIYHRLIEASSESGKERLFLENKNVFHTASNAFKMIPGTPFVYWFHQNFLNSFAQNPPLNKLAAPRKGLVTLDNERFVRLWHEVFIDKVGFNINNAAQVVSRNVKWIPILKGGQYRKWYGNNFNLVNWENNGQEIKDNIVKTYKGGSYTKEVRSEEKYFLEGITWTVVSTTKTSFRRYKEGFIFSNSGESVTSALGADALDYFTGLLNSKYAEKVLAVLSPTMGFESGYVGLIPTPEELSRKKNVVSLVQSCINNSKVDWDSFEISWDFRCHPLVDMIAKGGSSFEIGQISLAECYLLWESECADRFNHLKENEEELNRIFIDIYGLQDELTPEVEDKDVSVRKADLGRDIRSLISYAVGCMFGRYSLNDPGLAYAGGKWDDSKYSTIIPEKDNIIPICDDDYFDDDITARFIKWVETVYGKDTLEENLKFIANALGGKGQPREVIRNYFLNDFYADHLKIYQKRPIYWLFDSGKKNGFKALVYMHRYQSDLLARMRTDYVHEMQERYRTQLHNLAEDISTASGSQKIKLTKLQKKVQEQALEIQKYEERIHHLADQNIKIDLDDGVKHNYALFGNVLAKIK